jgi:hypothetical protein
MMQQTQARRNRDGSNWAFFTLTVGMACFDPIIRAKFSGRTGPAAGI